MSRENSIILQTSTAFSLRIVKMYKHLLAVKKETVLSKQVLRSGTSISANLTEAYSAASRKDFLAKVYIAFKESSETLHWLVLLYKSDYLTQTEFDSISSDCKEIENMLAKTIKTLKSSS